MKNPFRAQAILKVPSFHQDHPNYRWWVLGNILVTTFMSIIESTVVNTALPKMQNSFGTSLDTIEWVLTAFQMAFAVSMPLAGWLAEKWGYKRTFLLALVLFTFGSLACSFAWNESVLIFFRVLQGFGGGMIMPVGMTIVTRVFPLEQRGMAMGFYGIAAAASVSIGPSLGGFLTDNFGWSSVFLVNVPIGLLALGATLIIQQEYRNSKIGAFDWWGFIFISLFLLTLILALADGNASWNTGGWTSTFILSCLTLSGLSLLIFVLVELQTTHPLIDLKLFTNRDFLISNILLFFVGLLLLGSTFLMPVYLQGVLGYTALQSGILFLPLGFIQGAISPVTGILADKITPKLPAILGMAALFFSFYLNTLLSTNPPFWLLMLPICLRGLGFGFLFISLNAAAMNSLSKAQLAQGSGLTTLSRQIGSSFGVAIFGTIISQRNIFHSATTGEGITAWTESLRQSVGQLQFSLISQGGQTSSNAMNLGQSMIMGQINTNSFVLAINDAFFIMVALAVLCGLLVLLFKKKKS